MKDAAASFSDAEAARGLMRAAERAALATRLQAEPSGWPYASLVLVAFDHDAAPLLLLSDLAEHSRNIAADPRLSLLIDATAPCEEPLAGARLSLLGTAARTDSPRLRQRFVARHPSAARYAGFADFRLYRVSLERAHFVAGFGGIRWIEGGVLRLEIDPAELDALAAATETLAALHADAIDAAAQRITGMRHRGWRLTGLDPDGADLRCGGATARLCFAQPQVTAAAIGPAFAAALAAAATAPS
jgi:putative heme iron utilization protein